MSLFSGSGRGGRIPLSNSCQEGRVKPCDSSTLPATKAEAFTWYIIPNDQSTAILHRVHAVLDAFATSHKAKLSVVEDPAGSLASAIVDRGWAADEAVVEAFATNTSATSGGARKFKLISLKICCSK